MFFRLGEQIYTHRLKSFDQIDNTMLSLSEHSVYPHDILSVWFFLLTVSQAYGESTLWTFLKIIDIFQMRLFRLLYKEWTKPLVGNLKEKKWNWFKGILLNFPENIDKIIKAIPHSKTNLYTQNSIYILTANIWKAKCLMYFEEIYKKGNIKFLMSLDAGKGQWFGS